MAIPGNGISLRLSLTFFLLCLPSSLTFAQTVPSPPTIDSYPDNPSGLKRLAKDIINAQKSGESAKAGALLDSMVISDPAKWYLANFDDGATSRVLEKYQANQKSLSAQLANFFVTSQVEGFREIESVRYDKDCDDNASVQTFNTLDARLNPFPLYELRFTKGDQFKRLFAFAYIDGGFRFVLTPDFSQPPPHLGPGERETADGKVRTVKQGGPVTAASLITKIPPAYPEIARRERLSGTVRLHAIIDKEGKVAELRVISGRCSLSRASIDAVKNWRYRPTLLNGNPVEVDTTIDVIFSLNN